MVFLRIVVGTIALLCSITGAGALVVASVTVIVKWY